MGKDKSASPHTRSKSIDYQSMGQSLRELVDDPKSVETKYNTMLEEFPTSRGVKKDKSARPHTRSKSIDYQCVSQSLRALNVTVDKTIDGKDEKSLSLGERKFSDSKLSSSASSRSMSIDNLSPFVGMNI